MTKLFTRIIVAEIVCAAITATLLLSLDWRVALAIGSTIGLTTCVATFRGLEPWRWAKLAARWALRGRRRRLRLDPPDVDTVTIDGQTVGVMVR